jgi:Tol biopolymer transport system component
MTDIDLHVITPEPPDNLLSWSGLDTKIRRRQHRQAIAAVVGCVLITASIVVGIVQVGGSSNAPVPTGGVHRNGPLLFGSGHERTHGLDTARLTLMNPDGSGKRQVTDASTVVDASVSADGSQIAYVEQVDTPSTGGSFHAHLSIWVVNADGTNNHELVRCAEGCLDVEWSPTAPEIAFSDGAIKVVDLDGHITQVCGDRCGRTLDQPVWSPDGREIAFSESGFIGEIGLLQDPPSAIWVADRDGGHARKLTDTECPHSSCTTDVSPSWSPNGRQIAFARWSTRFAATKTSPDGGPRGLYVVPATGGRPRPLWRCRESACQVRDVQWSPSGDAVAFVSDSVGPGLQVVTTRGAKIRVAPPTFYDHGRRTPAYVQSFAWAPDGTKLAMLASPTRAVAFLAISSLGASGVRTVEVLHTSAALDGPLVWLPAGRPPR